MIPCLLISLARAPDRRAAMLAQFEALGIPVTVLEATDGVALSPEQRARVDHDKRRAITRFPLTDGEIGCYFSHLRAMRALLDGPHAMAAVFEDDVRLAPDLGTVLDAIEVMGPRFDFLFLHRKFKRNEFFVPCRALGIVSDQPTHPTRHARARPGHDDRGEPRLSPDLPLGNAIGRVGRMSMDAPGYVVTRAGAERFLAHATAIGHAVDKEIHRWWVSGLSLYGLERPVVKAVPSVPSTLDGDRAERVAYADADALRWRWWRFLTAASDSVNKRWRFGAYVRAGRAALAGEGDME